MSKFIHLHSLSIYSLLFVNYISKKLNEGFCSRGKNSSLIKRNKSMNHENPTSIQLKTLFNYFPIFPAFWNWASWLPLTENAFILKLFISHKLFASSSLYHLFLKAYSWASWNTSFCNELDSIVLVLSSLQRYFHLLFFKPILKVGSCKVHILAHPFYR